MNISVLQCKKFSYNYSNGFFGQREVKDYELDLELSNGREYYLSSNGKAEKYTLCENTILIRKPGETVQSFGSQNSIILTIKFGKLEEGDFNYVRNLTRKTSPLINNPVIDDLPPLVVIKNPFEIKGIYERLLNLAPHENAENLIMQLIYLINAQVCQDKFEQSQTKKTPCDLIFNYLKNNFNRHISLDELAKTVHLEKSYLIRLFYSKYKKTPIQALIDFRLEHACHLVLESDMKVGDICDICGFNTLSFFIKQYKKKFGFTPLEHRKK